MEKRLTKIEYIKKILSIEGKSYKCTYCKYYEPNYKKSSNEAKTFFKNKCLSCLEHHSLMKSENVSVNWRVSNFKPLYDWEDFDKE